MPARSPLLFTRAAVVADLSRAGLDAALARGSLLRVRPGRYANAREWQATHVEERQRQLFAAAQEDAEVEPIAANITAAAAHALPLFRVRDERIHTVNVDGRAASSTSRCFRHDDACDPADIVRLDGRLTTSLSRTVFDVIRTQPAETAITVIDAALRQVAVDGSGRVRDIEAAERLRDDIRRHVDAGVGARGIVQARRMVDLAHPGADGPGESVSRLYLADLGFAPIEVQVRVAGPDGGEYSVDLGFAGVLAEFDGEHKYREPSFLRGRTAEQAVIDEKRREDWIRATTRQPFLRWGMADIATRGALADRLRAFHVFARRTPIR
ncbi:hypothetical protein [Microbacterium sp. NPDC055683]